MRYIEYVWLVGAAVLVVFLATNFGNMAWYQYLVAFVGIVISTFMYTFRRNMRIQVDKKLEEEENEYNEN
ncbi:MAG: hypothetical protein R3B47_21310 [Bacteroidia bacterium]